MTSFVAFADGAQVFLRFQLGGVPISNRLWFLNRQPPTTGTQLQNLADGVSAWYQSDLLPALGNDLLFLGAEAHAWDSSPPPIFAVSSASVLGGAPVKSCSANIAVAVTLKGSTAQTFPNNHSFVPGIPIDQVEGNEYSSALQHAIFEAYVHLIDLAVGFGPFPAWRWVVASSWTSGSLRTHLAFARMDFVRFRSRRVSQRRRRLRA